MAPGVGPSTERSLRVSAATLARVVFPHPEDGAPVLALEHKAIVHPGDNGPQVTVQAQPFGGAVRLPSPDALDLHLGGFNYDSRRSQSEQDMRVFIQPSSWRALVTLCSKVLDADRPLINVDPSRELREEFADSLAIELHADQISIEPTALLVERVPTPTVNLRAPGRPTARIYWIHEVVILDEALCRLILARSEDQSAAALSVAALEAAHGSGWGRANGILAAPLARIEAVYRSTPLRTRAAPLPFGDTRLAANVAAVVGIESPRYEPLGGSN